MEARFPAQVAKERRSWARRHPEPLKALIGVTLIGLFCGSVIPVHFHTHHEVITNIVYCDAPFGTYWVDTWGIVTFFAGHIDSDLRESYTIKYIEGTEVKTILLGAVADDFSDWKATRVILGEQKDYFELNLWSERGTNWFGVEVYQTKNPDTILVIPDPRLFGYSQGPWENMTQGAT